MSVARYSCLVLILLATASMLSADHLHDLLQDSSRNHLKSKFKRSPSTFGDTCSRKTNRVDDDTTTMDVTFPRASIKHSDQYLCTSQKVPFNGEESYIVKFNPIASMNISHHMLVYGCQDAGSNEKFWDCGRRSVCSGKHTILYAWARNAPSLDMPDGLGFRFFVFSRIGGDSGYNYLILQMHYVNPTKPGEYDCSGFSATITTLKQNYYAGIYLLGSPWISIPAHSPMSTVDISCPNTATASIHVFAFRTHAHDFGQVITGYRYRNGIYKMIGKGNPQWPHAFYPRVGGAIDIEPGDTIIARCTYRNDQDRVVHQGMGGGDEMCNFYMMYYTADVSLVNKDLECWGNMYPRIKFPPNANDPAPYPGYAGADSDKAIRAGESNPHHQDVESTRDPGNAVNEGLSQVPGTSSDVVFDQLWPAALSGVGQVGGVAVDWRRGVYVFHRAERV
ncbi:unnamed protein product [Clavelina lepadiformis]|uniref:peptidylglycine monooxygenase n=1 Tax=Clavelina lepadiformis TaxID=159417 RepID=A0ABP0FFH9_CLALP